MQDEIAALLGSLMVSALTVVVVWLVLRHRREVRELLSRERMAALDKGVEIPWELDAARPRRASRLQLKAAFLLAGMGVGLIAASAVSGGRDARDMMPFGLFLLVVGLAMFAYDRFFGRHEWKRAAELDEELTRAYIRRLDRSGAQAHDAASQNVGAVR